MRRLWAWMLVLCLLAGCAPAASPAGDQETGEDAVSPPARDQQEEAEPPAPTEEELDRRQVETLLAGLTLEEQVGQLFLARCPAAGGAEDAAAYHLGGYVLFGRDFQDDAGGWLTREAFLDTVEAYQSAAAEDTGIPLLLASDEEGGSVTRASRDPNLFAAPFSSPQALLAAGGEEALVSDARDKSLALLDLGINVNLAPVCDVTTDPGAFIYSRTFGTGAEEAADYTAAVVEAMAQAGMGSVLKHFPGYGGNADTHTGIALDPRPMEQFRQEDFLPFAAGMEAGGDTTAVLVSHNIVSCMDENLPASLSPAVHAVLREELGFDGVIMTDDLAMEAVAAYAGEGDVAVMALLAGNDLILTTDYASQIPAVLAAVEEGRLDQETVETACRRVLTWKQALDLLG